MAFAPRIPFTGLWFANSRFAVPDSDEQCKSMVDGRTLTGNVGEPRVDCRKRHDNKPSHQDMAMAKVEHGSQQADILEQGNIYFMYRPQVEETDPDSVGDVQQLYMVLKPDGGRYRLIVIGQKHLPDVGQHEQGWAFVEALNKDPAELEKGLRQQHYQTETRGKRVQPAVRPA